MVGVSIPARPDSNPQDLIEGLREDDPVTAQAAEDMLVKVGSAAVPYLEKALTDSNFLVRRRAVEALGAIGPQAKHAAPELVQLLMDAQFMVSEAAEKALMQIGEDAVPALADAAKSDQEGLRKAAVAVLRHSGPKGTPILIKLLKNDENAYIRLSAAEALGEANLVTPEVVQALVGGLSALDDGVRRVSADSLGELGASASAAAKPLLYIVQNDPDSLVRKKASDAILRIGPEAASALQAAAQGSDPAAQKIASELLKQIQVSSATRHE